MRAYPLREYLSALKAVRDRAVRGKVVLLMRE
jgi:hypothetical protein